MVHRLARSISRSSLQCQTTGSRPRLSEAARWQTIQRLHAAQGQGSNRFVRYQSSSTTSSTLIPLGLPPPPPPPPPATPLPLHAVISTFDLFSIGIGPSSSHTVGPMRAAKIFTHSLPAHLIPHIHSLKCSLHGSLAATGMGHMTPHAVLLGLMGEDPESVDTTRLGKVLDEVRAVGEVDLGLVQGQTKRVKFSIEKDLTWHLQPLPAHPNGLRFTVFNESGDMLATNEYFSVGGGFVVNKETQTAENLYYMDIHPSNAEPSRRDQTHGQAAPSPTSPPPAPLPLLLASPNATDTPASPQEVDPAVPIVPGQPPYLFATAAQLLEICREQNMTIAQVVWENERAFRTESEIRENTMKLWDVMDECIRNGVTSTEEHLPGGLNVRRRAPGLYKRLQKGFYSSPDMEPPIRRPSSNERHESNAGVKKSTDGSTALSPFKRNGRIGRRDHAVALVPKRTTPVFPGIEYLSCMAIAVNEVNAAGGRVVTAPTNGAAGVIPATLKYVTEFISQDPERDTMTFLLTASAIGMLFKRGATISAAEGGCMAEVGVACSMAASGIAACLGAEPEVVLQAAEIGIEHNLGLTCDPLGGLVQIPCIERNSLGAVKAVTAAQLAMAGGGQHTVSLDDAIEACRTTAQDMHVHYKETSLAGLATTVKIPLSSPAC
ncbi:serine dehydratase alpha chain-domain-containing protein [Kockovaella imperatae]|uniref:Serine dehydratase alpha chain-domain-containing protein n=1 Tax=Kockovaella imperatae TaxID=4999 RepID=A0A1Y1UHI0_9TREE|nr:serine dehydratase alpha chain-domain-containing protein [Kockovaella imperatae]ORX37449.1 serine dehydratase alpha chain-domain-containing protein [Kockovaella imperatae]